MWSDNETETDLLGFQHLKGCVTRIVRDDSLLPATIGVFGDWGSGKSSLLKMVEEELSKDEDTLVLWFNGWLFETFEDAKTALMGTIIDEIVAKRTIGEKGKEGAKRLAVRLLKRIPVFRLAGAGARAAWAYAIAGAPGAGMSVAADGLSLVRDAVRHAEEAAKNVEEMNVGELEEALASDAGQNLRRGVREFRQDFAKLLDETNIKRLVVLIDDLDRCTPDTIIGTLEAVKLFLFVPGTAFVLGADERLVRYAVRRRFPELPGEKVEVGRDYLEKLIQFPVRVPPLGRAEMETYINVLFAKKAGVSDEQFDAVRKCVVNCGPETLLDVRFNLGIAKTVLGGNVPKPLEEGLSLAQRIAPVLASGLAGNPRQCKRFLNTLVMRVEMAESRGVTLQRRALAKLMLLEYFFNESFKQLAKAQAEQNGHPAEVAAAEEACRPKPAVPTDNVEGGEDEARSQRRVKGPRAARLDEREVVAWLADPVLREWVTSDPPLADVDLRPYFFFSRDTLGPLGTAMQRMSPAAQELLTLLFQEGKARLNTTLRRAGELSPVDAAAVFEVLAEKARREEDGGKDDSALMRALDWVGARRELLGQAMTLLLDLPEDALPVSLPPLVAKLGKTDDEKTLIRRVLTKWSGSSTPRFKAAANNVLQKL